MKIDMTFNHIRRTPSLEERIAAKSEKLMPLCGAKRDLTIRWQCSRGEGGYQVEIRLTVLGLPFHSRAQSATLPKAMDGAVNKIERQLKKRREKRHSSSRIESPLRHKKAA